MKLELSKEDLNEAVKNYLASKSMYVDSVSVTSKRDGGAYAEIIIDKPETEVCDSACKEVCDKPEDSSY